jgi:hypothetical protein
MIADAAHTIDWYHPAHGGRGPVSSTGAVVSHLPGVKTSVKEAANSMAADAWVTLLFHRQTGAASVNVIGPPPLETDSYVYLHDTDPGGEGIGNAFGRKHKRSAMSIEMGWTQTHAWGQPLAHPIHHDGLHVLQNAMDRAARRYKG